MKGQKSTRVDMLSVEMVNAANILEKHYENSMGWEKDTKRLKK